MEFSSVFSSVLTMGIMIGIGSLLRRHVVFGEEARVILIGIILNVAVPCIILYSVFQFPMDMEIFRLVLITLVVSVLLNLTGIGIGWLAATLMKMPKQKAREMAIVSGLGNTGFIGLPLCAILFGPKGALLAAVFDAGLDITIWTAAVLMLQRSAKFSIRSLREVVNLPMISIAVGLTLAYFQFQPPDLVVSLTGTLANLASPLAMIYIGLLVPSLWVKRNTIPKLQLGVPVVLKLLIFPAVTIVFLHIAALDADMSKVVLVQSAMPTITLASILFTKYSADGDMGAAATVSSTLISLLTIPLMVYFGVKFI